MNVSAPSDDLAISNSDKSVDIFANEETVLKALGTIRHSAIPTSDKDKLRDLFLNYTGTSDETKRNQLKTETIATLKQHKDLASILLGKSNLNPAKAPQTANTEATGTNDIGRTRPAPTFSSVAVKPVTPTTSTSVSTPPTPTPTVSKPEPIKTTEVVSEPTPAPVPTPTVTPDATSPASTTPSPETPPTSPVSLDARQRINEIKFDINKQVGNPVNLIEADEKIGRAYMTSLLDAMKRSAHGDTDLTALEANYQNALKLIKEKSLGDTAPASNKPELIEEPTIKPTSNASPVPEPIPTPPVEISSTVPTPPPLTSTETTAHPVAGTNASETLSTPNYSKTNSTGLYHQPADETDAEALAKKPEPAKGIASLTSKLLWKNNSTPDSLKNSPSPKSAVSNANTVKRVAVATSDSLDDNSPLAPTSESSVSKNEETDTLKSVASTADTLDDKMVKLKTEAKARDEAAKNPITDLNASAIDAGLKQLLSEWVLFRSSGFLGSGPSGINHPLYKKLAQLPMAAVVAGRFEGVTPDIKRHLADYMTGWRYEQGVLHEMGETFEHYLRRVIKQILERQRTTPSK